MQGAQGQCSNRRRVSNKSRVSVKRRGFEVHVLIEIFWYITFALTAVWSRKLPVTLSEKSPDHSQNMTLHLCVFLCTRVYMYIVQFAVWTTNPNNKSTSWSSHSLFHIYTGTQSNVSVHLCVPMYVCLYTLWVKKSIPLRFSDIFSQTVGNFLTIFYTPIICSYVR